jgi:hypothetical protein
VVAAVAYNRLIRLGFIEDRGLTRRLTEAGRNLKKILDSAPVERKTRTRELYGWCAKAWCACGWSCHGTGRAEVWLAARHHRAEFADAARPAT